LEKIAFMAICLNLQAVRDDEIEELSTDANSLKDFLRSCIAGDPLGPQTNLYYYHGLHYLLTGSDSKGDEPLCYLLYKGEEIGNTGDSCVTAINSKQLAAFDNALQAIDKTELLRHYDGKAMIEAEIDPPIWGSDPEEAKCALCEDLDSLKEFFKVAHARNEGAIIWMN
jgi:hypothetical protein